MPFSLRPCLPVVLSLLCCACSTPEERADAAFAELTAMVQQLRAELAGIGSEAAAQQALPLLEEQAQELREILEQLDELALHPDMSPEARRRVGATHHAPLRAATDAAMEELVRLARHGLYHVEGLNRLARRELAHYSTKGVHPWPQAVCAGREYRVKSRHRRGRGKS